MCLRLIDAKKSQHPVSLQCSVHGVIPALGLDNRIGFCRGVTDAP
jgi:hypothetical protein